MSGRVSPFEALTGVEKQIRWLEVQSVRLPYVKGTLEKPFAEREIERMEQTDVHESSERTDLHERRAQPEPTQQPKAVLQEKPMAQHSAPQADFQRTRHRQYDAVIARMKQAEQRISGYSPLN